MKSNPSSSKSASARKQSPGRAQRSAREARLDGFPASGELPTYRAEGFADTQGVLWRSQDPKNAALVRINSAWVADCRKTKHLRMYCAPKKKKQKSRAKPWNQAVHEHIRLSESECDLTSSGLQSLPERSFTAPAAIRVINGIERGRRPYARDLRRWAKIRAQNQLRILKNAKDRRADTHERMRRSYENRPAWIIESEKYRLSLARISKIVDLLGDLQCLMQAEQMCKKLGVLRDQQSDVLALDLLKFTLEDKETFDLENPAFERFRKQIHVGRINAYVQFFYHSMGAQPHKYTVQPCRDGDKAAHFDLKSVESPLPWLLLEHDMIVGLHSDYIEEQAQKAARRAKKAADRAKNPALFEELDRRWGLYDVYLEKERVAAQMAQQAALRAEEIAQKERLEALETQRLIDNRLARKEKRLAHRLARQGRCKANRESRADLLSEKYKKLFAKLGYTAQKNNGPATSAALDVARNSAGNSAASNCCEAGEWACGADRAKKTKSKRSSYRRSGGGFYRKVWRRRLHEFQLGRYGNLGRLDWGLRAPFLSFAHIRSTRLTKLVFAHKMEPTMSTPSQPTHRLLIVDDEVVTVTLLQRTFQQIGLAVETAHNGRECLEKAKNFAPDLILMDIIMPEMDGLDACRQLKAMPQTASIPVIFLTTRAGKRHRLIGLRLGAVDYIGKPIDLSETVARVQNHLRVQDVYRESAKAHEALAQAQEQVAAVAAARDIAHKINNLIGVVSGYAELLPLHKDQPEKFDKMLKAIGEASGRMKAMTEELSALSSASSARMEKADALAPAQDEQESVLN